MLDLLRARWRLGKPTASLPAAGRDLPERFRGMPMLTVIKRGVEDRGGEARAAEEGAGPPRELPPALVVVGEDGRIALDLGACLFSPEEAGTWEAGTIAYTRDYRLASSTRDGLVAQGGEVELAHALDDRMRRLFGRSLRLRSVVAGSCGGCEAELQALGNVVFDLARFGIQFVASPRHADGIVVTGAVNRAMNEALALTYEATPAPRIVIAVGACALSGGPFRGSPEIAGCLPPGLPVDLYVPGCPPHPLTLLDGLLRLLGRLPPERITPPAPATPPAPIAS